MIILLHILCIILCWIDILNTCSNIKTSAYSLTSWQGLLVSIGGSVLAFGLTLGSGCGTRIGLYVSLGSLKLGSSCISCSRYRSLSSSSSGRSSSSSSSLMVARSGGLTCTYRLMLDIISNLIVRIVNIHP